jgi:hypothetical protein
VSDGRATSGHWPGLAARRALAGLFPAALGERRQGLAIELVLGLEVIVEAASGEPRGRHDLVDGDFRETAPVEERARALDDAHTGLALVFRRIGHG